MQSLINNYGFTLLEMLLSVFILSLITILVSFNVVDEVRKNQLRDDAYKIQMALETARSCSIATSSKSKLEFLSDKILYTCSSMKKEIKFDDRKLKTNFPNNIAVFNQKGAINRAATISVCLENTCKNLTIGIGKSDVKIK